MCQQKIFQEVLCQLQFLPFPPSATLATSAITPTTTPVALPVGRLVGGGGLIAREFYGNLTRIATTDIYTLKQFLLLNQVLWKSGLGIFGLTSEHHHANGKDLFNVGVRSHVAKADGNQASKGKVDGCAIAGLQNHAVSGSLTEE